MHSAGKLDAIEVGKAEVEQNDSGLGFGDVVAACRRRRGTRSSGSRRALKTEVEVVPNGGVVFNDQHRGQYRRQRDRVRPVMRASLRVRMSALAVIASHGTWFLSYCKASGR